jgi:Tol biopolymer transport system component
VDRNGKEADIAAAPRAYQYPQISPDGTRIAVTALGDGADIWMLDTKTTAISRLTFDPGADTSPVWIVQQWSDNLHRLDNVR